MSCRFIAASRAKAKRGANGLHASPLMRPPRGECRYMLRRGEMRLRYWCHDHPPLVCGARDAEVGDAKVPVGTKMRLDAGRTDTATRSRPVDAVSGEAAVKANSRRSQPSLLMHHGGDVNHDRAVRVSGRRHGAGYVNQSTHSACRCRRPANRETRRRVINVGNFRAAPVMVDPNACISATLSQVATPRSTEHR